LLSPCEHKENVNSTSFTTPDLLYTTSTRTANKPQKDRQSKHKSGHNVSS